MYTFMFCFLISDDVMLPHRTVLFSAFSPVYVSILYEKTKARSLENITSSAGNGKNLQAKKVCYIVLPIWPTWRHAKTLYNPGYSKWEGANGGTTIFS